MARLKTLDAYAAYLAAQHAKDQEAVAAQLALTLYPLWSLVQFAALDASMPTWLGAVLPRIKTAYLQSQKLSAVFAQNARFAALPTAAPLPITVPDVEHPSGISAGAFQMPDLGVGKLIDVGEPFDAQKVGVSLTIEADYKTKDQMPGPEDELMDNALVRSSGASVRLAVDGSRNVTNNVLKARSGAVGFARVTDSKPCHFCALLASRGAVYGKSSFLDSDSKFEANPGASKNLPEGFTNIAKVHNNCKCTLRPVYSKSQSMDEAATYYRDSWDDIYNSNRKLKNSGQINEFRKWLKDNPYKPKPADEDSLAKDLDDRQAALLAAGFEPHSPQVQWAVQQKKHFAA